jgi:hypothetical protein
MRVEGEVVKGHIKGSSRHPNLSLSLSLFPLLLLLERRNLAMKVTDGVCSRLQCSLHGIEFPTKIKIFGSQGSYVIR